MLVLLVVACADGPSTDPAGSDGDAPQPPPVADTAAPEVACTQSGTPARPALRRLSAEQVRWTVTDLVARWGAPDQVAALAARTDADWAAWLPADAPTSSRDDPRGGFQRLDGTVFQEHVDGQLQLASWVALELGLGDTTAGLACEPSAPDCADAWIAEVGRWIHRRPLTDAQRATYRAAHDAAPAGQGRRHALLLMLASPWFAYHVELGDPAAGPTALDPYELANRLAYHLWQSLPDDALYAAAADGRLATEQGYETEVRRVLADPRSDRGLGTFFADWLRVRRIERLDSVNHTPRYDAFAEGFDPTPDTHLALRDELVALGVHHVRHGPSTVDDWLLSNVHLTRDPALAGLYGEVPWDGSLPAPTLSDPRRVGLLTRVGLLASGGVETRPVQKGLTIREALMCDRMPNPPADADTAPHPASGSRTTREQLEVQTEAPGTPCAACHDGVINPLGFATEDFDALGRPRAAQRLFDGDTLVGTVPVDTRDEVLIDGETVAFADVAELTHHLLAAGVVHRCLARELSRYALGRLLDEAAEGCDVDALGDRLIAGMTLDELVVQTALLPSFRTLGAPPEAP